VTDSFYTFDSSDHHFPTLLHVTKATFPIQIFDVINFNFDVQNGCATIPDVTGATIHSMPDYSNSHFFYKLAYDGVTQ